MKEKGYVQVYTGNGKGKTTAALGLTRRAAGAGLKVFIGQFIKGMHYSELNALKRFDDRVTIKQLGGRNFILTGRNAREKLIEAAALVTETKEIKHYYQRRILARTGIEK